MKPVKLIHHHQFFVLMLLQVGYIAAKSTNFVTCGSVVKLMNTNYNVRLHSHDIKYGTGSGQQSVTAVENKEDGNSYWLIKAPTAEQCTRGKPIKCGHKIRFEHMSTKKNLHSHHVSSPLSGKQEVSAYGSNGHGDTGDHWIVECSGDYWERDEPISLKHVDTDVYLSVTERTYGSPIVGQREVVGEYTSDRNAQWQTMEGLFIHPDDMKSHHNVHSEL